MRRIITLTSDFGLEDEFVGIVKGVILGREPTALLVDLTHQIAAHDVRQAAFILAGAWQYFPVGTIHLAVVDPGVGSSRRVVLLEAAGQYFLAPDNGLLTLVRNGAGPSRVWLVNREELFLERVGSTFHGRDLFAPVAAALAGGLEPAQLGPPLDGGDLVALQGLEARLEEETSQLVGRVMQVDRFGNLVTNIGRELFDRYSGGAGPENWRISCGTSLVTGLSRTFSSRPVGTLQALFGSRDTLELVVNQGRADQYLQAGVGAEVRVTK